MSDSRRPLVTIGHQRAAHDTLAYMMDTHPLFQFVLEEPPVPEGRWRLCLCMKNVIALHSFEESWLALEALTFYRGWCRVAGMR